MKKLWLFFLLIGGIQSIGQCRILDPDATYIHYRLAVAANTSTSTIVIDLSSTTAYKHTETGELNIHSIKLSLDKVAASTCTVKFGVVTLASTTAGNVSWFYTKEHAVNVSNTDIGDEPNYYPNYIRLRVDAADSITDGSTPYLLTNDKSTTSTTYQNDVVLPTSAGGNVAPAQGDMVLAVSTGGAVVVIVEIEYHAQRR